MSFTVEHFESFLRDRENAKKLQEVSDILIKRFQMINKDYKRGSKFIPTWFQIGKGLSYILY